MGWNFSPVYAELYVIHSLKNLVDGLVSNHNDWKTRLLKEWDQVIGDLHTKVRLLKIDKETITLGVSDACWLQELYLLSPLLLKTINEKLDQPRIKQLRFKQTGKKHPKRSQRQSVQRPERAVRPPSPAEQKVLEGVRDTALREALTSFRNRCCRERNYEEKNSPPPSRVRHSATSGSTKNKSTGRGVSSSHADQLNKRKK